MSTPGSLETQITALQNRINEVTVDATADDLILISKAVEAIAGRATVFDVRNEGDSQRQQITALVDTLVASINTVKNEGVASIETAGQNSLTEIIATGLTVQNIHSAVLSL